MFVRVIQYKRGSYWRTAKAQASLRIRAVRCLQMKDDCMDQEEDSDKE